MLCLSKEKQFKNKIVSNSPPLSFAIAKIWYTISWATRSRQPNMIYELHIPLKKGWTLSSLNNPTVNFGNKSFVGLRGFCIVLHKVAISAKSHQMAAAIFSKLDWGFFLLPLRPNCRLIRQNLTPFPCYLASHSHY